MSSGRCTGSPIMALVHMHTIAFVGVHHILALRTDHAPRLRSPQCPVVFASRLVQPQPLPLGTHVDPKTVPPRPAQALPLLVSPFDLVPQPARTTLLHTVSP